MKNSLKHLSGLLVVMVLAVVILSIASYDVAAQSDSANSQEATDDVKYYQNDVLGIAITYPAVYQILEDQYLSREYGFIIVDSERNPVFEVSWLHESGREQQDSLVDEMVKQFSSISIAQSPIQINGRTGHACSSAWRGCQYAYIHFS